MRITHQVLLRQGNICVYLILFYPIFRSVSYNFQRFNASVREGSLSLKAPDKYMRFLSLSLSSLFLSRPGQTRARLYHLHTYYIFLPRKPFAKAIGSLHSGLRGTGFCDVQSSAAKNIRYLPSLSSFHRPFPSPYLSLSLSLSVLFVLSLALLPFVSPFRSLILVRVPLRTLRLGRSKEPSGGGDTAAC